MRSATSDSRSLSAGAPSNHRDLEVLKHYALAQRSRGGCFCAEDLEDLARLRY